MMDNSLMMCDECKLSVPSQDVRYELKSPNKTMVLCSSCRDRTSSKKNKAGIKNIVKEIETNIKPSQKTLSRKHELNQEKVKYSCSRCNYKFRYDSLGESNLRCPYCSKSDSIVKHRAFSSNNLIMELNE